MLEHKILNGERTAADILDSVIDVTAHADREMLKVGLLKTLFDLVKPCSISCLELIVKKGGDEVLADFEIDSEGLRKNNPDASVSFSRLKDDSSLLRCIDTRECVEEPLSEQTGRLRLVYPISDAKGAIVGFIDVSGSEFSATERYLMSAMLKLFHNYLHLLDESEKDTLTGLLNRRTFDRNLAKMLAEEPGHEGASDDVSPSPERRSIPQNSGNWLAVIDVDHFKKINDNYGHLYGDEVLLLLAGVMRQTFRAYDKLFRFGGEEFIVVLKKADDKGVVAALERFRNSVENFDFPQVGQVTISIGYVEIKNCDLPAELIARADEALYFAKDNGRNQLHGYADLVAAGAISHKEMKVSDDIEYF